MLSVDAVREPLLASPGAEDVVGFLRQAGSVLTACAAAVREDRRIESVPSLPGAREALAEAVQADPDRFGGPGIAGTVLHSSDRIASSLDTLVAELRRQAGQPEGGAYSGTGASASDSTEDGTGIPARRSGAGTGSP
jgi:hypothetical protein